MDSGELPEKVVLVVAEWSAPSLRKKKTRTGLRPAPTLRGWKLKFFVIKRDYGFQSVTRSIDGSFAYVFFFLLR